MPEKSPDVQVFNVIFNTIKQTTKNLVRKPDEEHRKFIIK